ncbi:unnamed protein product [Aphanomyces euteiches]
MRLLIIPLIAFIAASSSSLANRRLRTAAVSAGKQGTLAQNLPSHPRKPRTSHGKRETLEKLLPSHPQKPRTSHGKRETLEKLLPSHPQKPRTSHGKRETLEKLLPSHPQKPRTPRIDVGAGGVPRALCTPRKHAP